MRRTSPLIASPNDQCCLRAVLFVAMQRIVQAAGGGGGYGVRPTDRHLDLLCPAYTLTAMFGP